MSNTFKGNVELFERDKGWHYVSVPQTLSKPYEHLADRGLLAVTATVGATSWNTSLLPMGDGTQTCAAPRDNAPKHFSGFPQKLRHRARRQPAKKVYYTALRRLFS